MGAVTRAAVPVDGNSLDEAKTYLRIDGEAEDSALSALIGAAIEQCEAFIGRVTLRRAMTETLIPGGAWQWLSPVPVRAITSASSLAIDGATVFLNPTDYEADLNADGRGRVRFLKTVAQSRVVVAFEAGITSNWAGLSDSLRHGIVRLVAHYHAHRERADELGPPAAVAAMWRGERRVRL